MKIERTQKRKGQLEKWLKRMSMELDNARKEGACQDVFEGLQHQIGYCTGYLECLKWINKKNKE